MRFNNQDPRGHLSSDILSRNRHESYLNEYFQWLDAEQPADPVARQVTVIARSPASPVIMALEATAGELGARQIAVRAVFSDIEPERALHSAWRVISALSEGREHGDLVRWASSRGILEAHEQMILGRRMCWLGDAMRREPGRRDGFDLFEMDAPGTCQLGVQSFAAMWKFATPVPKWILREASAKQSNNKTSGPDHRGIATLSFFRQLEKPDTLCH